MADPRYCGISSIAKLLLSTLLLSVALAGACSSTERPQVGRLEGDIYAVVADEQVRRLAATEVRLLPQSPELRADLSAPCAIYDSVYTPLFPRLYESSGDLMELKLKTDSLRSLLGRGGNMREIARKLALSDSLKDSLNRTRYQAEQTIEAILEDRAVATAVSSADGRFVFDSVPAGPYFLAAIAKLGEEPPPPSMVRAMGGYNGPGRNDWVWMVPVTVAAGSADTVHLDRQSRRPGMRVANLCALVDSLNGARAETSDSAGDQ